MDFSLHPRMLLDAFFPPPATLLFRAFLASLYSINQFSLSALVVRTRYSVLSLPPRRQRISGIQIYKDTPKGTITSYYRIGPFEVSSAPMSAQGCKVLEIISQRGETMRGRGREIRRNSWLKASNPFRILLMKNPFSPLVYRK